jgi:hypothetical protein
MRNPAQSAARMDLHSVHLHGRNWIRKKFKDRDHAIGFSLSGNRGSWEEILERENLRTYYGSRVAYPHSVSWYIKDPTGYMIEVALWNDDQVKFG